MSTCYICFTDSHRSAPSRVLSIEETLIATGDDDGIVRLWDSRCPSGDEAVSKPVQSYDHHSDWITDMLWCTHLDAPRPRKEEQFSKRKREQHHFEPDSRDRLVCTSGDGTLSVIDVRAGKKGVEVSEDQEDELLSIASIKGFVCGSGALTAVARSWLWGHNWAFSPFGHRLGAYSTT